jgi:hypothetical protein
LPVRAVNRRHLEPHCPRFHQRHPTAHRPGDIPDPEPIQLVPATSCTTLKAAVTPNGVDVVLMPGEQTCGSEADGAAERPNFTSAASETTLNIAVTPNILRRRSPDPPQRIAEYF